MKKIPRFAGIVLVFVFFASTSEIFASRLESEPWQPNGSPEIGTKRSAPAIDETENAANDVERPAKSNGKLAEMQQKAAEKLSGREFSSPEQAIQAIEKATMALEKIQSQVDSAPISSSTKEEVYVFLGEVIRELNGFQAELEAAGSTEAATETLREMTNYLRSVGEETKTLLQQVKQEAGEVSQEQIEAAIDQIETMLKVLKVSCREQTAQIEAIEADLAELETLALDLTSALQAKDYAEAKSLIQQSETLITETIENAETIVKECEMEIPAR